MIKAQYCVASYVYWCLPAYTNWSVRRVTIVSAHVTDGVRGDLLLNFTSEPLVGILLCMSQMHH